MIRIEYNSSPLQRTVGHFGLQPLLRVKSHFTHKKIDMTMNL
jgi:hypothetical protein